MSVYDRLYLSQSESDELIDGGRTLAEFITTLRSEDRTLATSLLDLELETVLGPEEISDLLALIDRHSNRSESHLSALRDLLLLARGRSDEIYMDRIELSVGRWSEQAIPAYQELGFFQDGVPSIRESDVDLQGADDFERRPDCWFLRADSSRILEVDTYPHCPGVFAKLVNGLARIARGRLHLDRVRCQELTLFHWTPEKSESVEVHFCLDGRDHTVHGYCESKFGVGYDMVLDGINRLTDAGQFMFWGEPGYIVFVTDWEAERLRRERGIVLLHPSRQVF